MHSSCLLFFSVAGLLFTVSFPTIVSMYANVTRVILLPLIISLLPLITAVHYVHFLIWRLSVLSTGGGIYHFSLVCLFSLVSFFCADCLLLFWTRVVARLLRGKTCRGETFIPIPQIPRHGRI